jgi:hypothetical protein
MLSEGAKIGTPGAIISKGRFRKYMIASRIITPQSGVGGCKPKPRKLRDAID